MSADLLTLKHGEIHLVVDTSYGGHVREFSLAGKNTLAVATPAFGSTFWPSPQSAWGWPPLSVLDSAPYSVLNHNSLIEIESQICPQSGLRVRKRFWFECDVLRVEYELKNCSKTKVSYAPWEITRIKGGLTFYKSEQEILPQSNAVVSREGGCLWHDYQPDIQDGNQKIFGNGSAGWVANVHQGLLLVKRFAQVPVACVAPEEAEVEIYAHGDSHNAYIEMEQQGRYQELGPEESMLWPVDWLLAQVPHDVSTRVGSTGLVQLVEAL